MGLGKTLMATVLLAQSHLEMGKNWSRNGAVDGIGSRIGGGGGGGCGGAPPSLVVCPPTLVGHWLDEMRK